MTLSSASPSASGGGTSTVSFDKTIQKELDEVGCYAGGTDGVIGPETDAAIMAFQEASGLEVDAELGPETDAALKADAKAGKTVCTGTPSPTTSPTSTGTAACTATSITQALESGEKLLNYACYDVSGQRWAAGQQTAGPDVSNFFLKDESAKWILVPNDEVCGTASAGLPAGMLKMCGLT